MQRAYLFRDKHTQQKTTKISVLHPLNSLSLDSSDFSDQIYSKKEMDLDSLQTSFQKQNNPPRLKFSNLQRISSDFPIKCSSNQFLNLSPIQNLNEKHFNQSLKNVSNRNRACFPIPKNHGVITKLTEETKISFRNMKNKQIIINKITQFQKYLTRLLQNLNHYKQDLLPISPFPKKTSNKLISQIYKASKSQTKEIKQKYTNQAQIFSYKVINVFNEFQRLRNQVQQRKFGLGDVEKSNYVKILQKIFLQTQKAMQLIVKGMLFDQGK